MRTLLVIISLVTFIVAIACAKNPKAATGDTKKGQQVFASGCVVCHSTESTETKVGPGLKGLFKRPKLTTGEPVSDQTVRALIENGKGNMPSFKDGLKDDQIKDLIAYLKTL